jgi:hypothetical protein
MIRLTQEERQKFALWLRQEAATDETLMAQMSKLKVSDQAMVSRRTELAAKRIVAQILEVTEEQVLQSQLTDHVPNKQESR